MRTTRVEYFRADYGHSIPPASCIGESATEPCGEPAEWVREWQSDQMAAPAFWYFCASHAASQAKQDGLSIAVDEGTEEK